MVKNKSAELTVAGWEAKLEQFFLKKMPALPTKAKEIIVQFGPWISLVLIVMSIPTLLMALGIYSAFGPMNYMGLRIHYGYNLAWWISIASMGLTAWALPGLFKRKMAAWKLMFYASLVMGAYYLVSMSLGQLIISTGISLYILFQIKSYYK